MVKIRERDPLTNIILEVLDDPSKKEMVFYLMCYAQLAKREDSFHLELNKFLSCAYRNFRNARSYWKDILVSMNLFLITDLYGNVYTGKDIYKVEEDGIYMIALRQEYLNQLDSISYKALRLWSIVNRFAIYKKTMTAHDAVILSALLFNEGLFEEVKNYCDICQERFAPEASFFRAMALISDFYSGAEEDTHHHLRKALQLINRLGDVFYGVNISKLKRDLDSVLRKTESGRSNNPIKIEFVNSKSKRRGLFVRLFIKLFQKFKNLFRRKQSNSYNFEAVLCSKSFRTPSINS